MDNGQREHSDHSNLGLYALFVILPVLITLRHQTVKLNFLISSDKRRGGWGVVVRDVVIFQHPVAGTIETYFGK